MKMANHGSPPTWVQLGHWHRGDQYLQAHHWEASAVCSMNATKSHLKAISHPLPPLPYAMFYLYHPVLPPSAIFLSPWPLLMPSMGCSYSDKVIPTFKNWNIHTDDKEAYIWQAASVNACCSYQGAGHVLIRKLHSNNLLQGYGTNNTVIVTFV